MLPRHMDTIEMTYRTNIALVTIEAAFDDLDHPEAAAVARVTLREIQHTQGDLQAVMILYRRAVMGSPKEFALVREIANRFFTLHAPA
jgi:hypothetical protein